MVTSPVLTVAEMDRDIKVIDSEEVGENTQAYKVDEEPIEETAQDASMYLLFNRWLNETCFVEDCALHHL